MKMESHFLRNDLDAIDEAISKIDVQGERYPEQAQKLIDR